jgi:UDP-N-acetylmuramoyl-L-alanyl-D-glutamate--2,6-diaminopimelate ligase
LSALLGEIIARLDAEGITTGELSSALAGIRVSAVTTDSRWVRPGTLFCAVRGTAGDGHAFLAAAREAGAAAALVESPSADVDLPQIQVGYGRRAAAFAAAACFGDPSRELTVVGVTGTNGKTTTAAILRHVMSRTKRAASIGTLGVVDADGNTLPGTEGLTTPGPGQISELLRRLSDAGVTTVAMEASSHALTQDRIAAVKFDAAIFTNLTRDHLDYHGSEQAYRDAKLKLIDLVREGGVLAPNVDDPAWRDVRREGLHLVRFGMHGLGEVQAEKIRFANGWVEWHLQTPSCSSRIEMPLFGMYNVYNALGAAAALWGLGWSSEMIAESLSDVPQVPGRLERIAATGGPAILIDYAHTPDALGRALQALRPLAQGRLIVVFGAGGDRDRGKRPEMGRVAAENADLTVVTTDNPRHEDPLRIIEDIESGMGGAPRLRILDRREAIARAIDLATARDFVLLAGKGHETYQIWGDEHRHFDEREVVAEILARKGLST